MFKGQEVHSISAHEGPHNALTVLLWKSNGVINPSALALPVTYSAGQNAMGFFDNLDNMSVVIELQHGWGEFFVLGAEHTADILNCFVFFLFVASLEHVVSPLSCLMDLF